MQTAGRLEYLVQQAALDKATADELDELITLLRSDASGEVTHRIEALMAETPLPARVQPDDAYWESVIQGVLKNSRDLHQDIRVRRIPLFRKWRWAAAAAAVLLLLGTALYRWLPVHHTHTNTPIAAITPARGNRATLTLADGSAVTLDSTGKQVIHQGNVTIQQQGGQLAYEGTAPDATVSYNVLSTPRGGQFQLILPDGTKVWLNAASTLRYPTAFTGKERKVTVTGEAYFEVAANAGMPFRVSIPNKMDVQVLGTAFNVQAYEDEQSSKTTLLEGSVKVGDQQLSPGQQARWENNTLQVVNDVNMNEVVAWRKGELIFNDVTMAEAARIIGRWYNVQIVFENKQLADSRFTISFLKGESITQVMNVISQYNEFNYRIVNNEIILSGGGRH